MSLLERLIQMAEDELTEYSTDARKIEKLRRKIGLSVPAAEQRKGREELLPLMPQGPIQNLILSQRQTVALPFWGLAGLGLLAGISFEKPLGWIASVAGTIAAFIIQKLGWKLEAKRLLMQTLDDIQVRSTQPLQ